MCVTSKIVLFAFLVNVTSIAVWADPPAKSDPVAHSGSVPKKTYKGRGYEEWLLEFQTELYPSARIDSLHALVIFGANGKARDVVPILIELIDGYPREAVLLFLMQGIEESPEIKTLVEGPQLHPDLRPYFHDFPDLALFRSAAQGLRRLSHLAVPELLGVFNQEQRGATGRTAAFSVLLLSKHPALGELMPKIVAQKQDQLAELVFVLWEDGGDNGPSREIYEASAPGLLALPEQRQVLRAISAITQSPHQLRPEISTPLLQKLVNTTTDEVIKVAAQKALEKAQTSALPAQK